MPRFMAWTRLHRTAYLAIALLIGLMAAFAQSQSLPDESIKLTLAPDERFQTISGWEATITTEVFNTGSDIFEPTTLPPAYLDIIADWSGIDRVRMEVHSGEERPDHVSRQYLTNQFTYPEYKELFYRAINDNDDPNVINPDGFDFSLIDHGMETYILPLQDRIRDRDIKINLCFVHFRKHQIPQLDPEEYAEFMQAMFQYMDTTYGMVPDFIEVMLEPDHDLSSIFDADLIARIVKTTAARLEPLGYSPGFIIGSVVKAWNAQQYLDAAARLDGALESVAEIAYHRYWGASDETITDLYASARNLNVQTSMLEWWDERATVKVLLKDLALGGVSAWQNAYLRDYISGWETGSFSPDWSRSAETAVFRNVPRGSFRLGLTGDPEGIAVAFQRPDDNSQVILVWSDMPRRIELGGINPDQEFDVAFIPEDTDLLTKKMRNLGQELPDLNRARRIRSDSGVVFSVPGPGLFLLVNGGTVR